LEKYMIVREAFSWIETATETNATAIPTRAAPAGGMSHYIVSLSAGYDAEGIVGSLTLKQGATVVGSWFVHGVMGMVFPSPVRIDPASAVTIELEAGGVGVVGAATLTGYTA